jgi:pyruvate dehydrogenase E1 component alpha subunit
MHLIDLEVGFLGSSAIVGNSIPVGVGAGYANQLRNDGTVTFIFLGDGAIEEGAFYESANFAAIHKLPVVFVLENNLYSVYTGLNPRQPSGRSISNLAEAIGLKSQKADDSNFDGSFSKFNELVDYSRSGAGPVLFEISTYRKLEHCGPNDDDYLNYRPKSEIKMYKDTDLIRVLEERLSIPADESDQIKTEIESEIDLAFEFAESSPFPTYLEATRGVYAN